MLREARDHDACVFAGRLVHRRSSPVRHEFRYRLSLLYFDVEDAQGLEGLAPWIGVDRRALVSWQRRDHFGDPSPLADAVRDLVGQSTGTRPLGRVFLLTSPRVLGYGFNPISLFFCRDVSGDIEAIVAEVTSTPWGERHCYVLPVPASQRGDAVHRFVTPKELHVSPFLGMRQDYRWRISTDARRLSVAISATVGSERPFAAAMSLARVPLRGASLARFLLHPPLGAAGTMAAIHFEALRLWWKGAPYHPHPHAAGGTSGKGQSHDDRRCAA